MNKWRFGELDTRAVKGGKFLLLTDFHVECGAFKYKVPKGFVTDFASIPIGMRSLFNRLGASRKPAVMHDYMYQVQFSTRAKCDDIFFEALVGAGVPIWKAMLYWLGVRLGGWTRGDW